MMGGGPAGTFNTSQNEEEFLLKYIESVNKGEKNFVVEQKTKVFNFLVDVDYKNNSALSVDEVLDLCDIIIKKVNSVTRHYKSAIVSLSEPKQDGTKIKSGIHINWPGLYVDSTNAINLRSHLVETLETLQPSRCS